MYSMGEDGKLYIIPLEIIPNEFILCYLFIILFSWKRLGHLYQKRRQQRMGEGD